MNQEHFTRWRQLHGSRRAMKEFGPNELFQLTNLLTKRWLRHMKPLCGPTEMQFICNDRKHVQKT